MRLGSVAVLQSNTMLDSGEEGSSKCTKVEAVEGFSDPRMA